MLLYRLCARMVECSANAMYIYIHSLYMDCLYCFRIPRNIHDRPAGQVYIKRNRSLGHGPMIGVYEMGGKLHA